MPTNFLTISLLKEHLRDVFPANDMPEIFGLHAIATVKANTARSTAIMDTIYRKAFIVRPPLTMDTEMEENVDRRMQ
jgi:hypothetical protein